MTSDFPGEFGSEPGLDRLLTKLASGPTQGELAGEQQALAMFRANIHPPTRDTGQLPVPLVAEAPARSGRDRRGAIRRLTAPSGRYRDAAPRTRVRLASASAAVLVAGFAAAAYAAVLPAPVQHVAYQAFHIFGVPDARQSSGAPNGASGLPKPHRTGPAGSTGPGPSHAVSPGTSESGSPSPSGGAKSPTPTSAAGNAAVTANAAAARIPAGSSDTIDGQLTRGGAPLPGVTVKLWERLAGTRTWSVVGQETTGSTGDVAIDVTSLTTNATFRLTDPDGPISAAVPVTVVPGISTTLVQGPRGLKDYVHVTTQFARQGNRVQLEELKDGTWVVIRTQKLGALGKATFVLDARRFKGVELQVVLLATIRHAQAISSPPLTGPPPG
jgi:hypothetical protein